VYFVLAGWVNVRSHVKLAVSVDTFMAQKAIRSPVNMHVQEEEVVKDFL
jgi:hypothetical protein